MPKFLVHNATNKSVRVAIEPWADLVELAPQGEVHFEYDEPAKVEFSLRNDGGATVGLMSRRVKLSASGREETWEDKTDIFSYEF
jgi:hypothetical protein